MKAIPIRNSFAQRFKAYFLITLMLFSFGAGTSKVLAVDESFFLSNDILFYDPDSCPVGGGEGTSSLVGNDNLEKILRYLVGKDLTLAQAAGVAGNLGRESGFNPAVIQGGRIADSSYSVEPNVGFGIAQWTDPGRQNGLVALAASSNRSILDLDLQLDYLWQELNTNRAGALPVLKAATTPEGAAYVFHNDFEGSDDTEEQVRQNRGGDAINIYNQYATLIPDGSTSITTGSTSCTGSGTASQYINGFAIYNQNDPQWANLPYGESTIGRAGCGPSAMAMIITALTGQTVTPADTAAYGAANGTLYENGVGGSYHNVHDIIGSHWGLSSTSLGKDVARINQGLRDGGLVIMAGEGAAPFTQNGHFIAIRAVTAEGKWLIGDSNGSAGGENSQTEWDPVYILSMNPSGYVELLTK